MNYDKMLKDITDATALRGVIDSVAQELASVESKIVSQEAEIEKRKGLEESVKNLGIKRAEVAKTLERHQAEMEKRIAALDKEGITLPIDAKPHKTVRL